MKILPTVLAVALLAFAAEAAPAPVAGGRRAPQLARLEKQKSELYKQLNAAIDESVRSLRAKNESEAAVGISYIKYLQEKVNALNASPSQLTSDRVQTQGAEGMDPGPEGPESRRTETLRQISDANVNNNNLFGEKERHPKGKEWQERYENRVTMQNKLEEWLKQREKEKDDDKRYKTEHGTTEKCPRHGVAESKKKNGTDGGAVYPCCRKCCKKSYLGCL